MPDQSGDLDDELPPRRPAVDEPLSADTMARIDRALDAVQRGWAEVDCYRLGHVIISSKALHIAAEALRQHLRDPQCWEPLAATPDVRHGQENGQP